jgi:ankyrin repeat protein
MRTQILRWWSGVAAGLACAAVLVVTLGAATGTVPDAAMTGDRDALKQLLKQGADVNAVQGDGVTALHWAATRGDADMASMLLVAGANHRAATRFGGYQPLHVAAERGYAAVVRTLVKAGADANATTLQGTTPLMLAAQAGDTDTLSALLDGGAKANAKEAERGHTALMFAAAANRLPAVKLLLARGADPTIATTVTDLAALSRDGANPEGRTLANTSAGASTATAPTRRPAPAAAANAPRPRVAGLDRQYFFNELVAAQGGMAPLHFAARNGYAEVALALVDAGVDVNVLKGGDLASPLLMATVNGHFDLASQLLDRGADPNLAAENGVAPLYAVLNLRWAQEAGYPQPWSHLDQKTSYLDYMKKLLEKGADPNARITKKVWYSGYNFDLSGVDEVGATPFWRAAYGADVDAMKLLVSFGADPSIPTAKPPGRPRTGDADIRRTVDVSGLPEIPVGGPGVPPLLAATGVGYSEGFAANSHRYSPGGMLAAVKYMVEELGVDVNLRDHEGNTAMHHAASRGDNEMIRYLVSKGADPKAVNREGQTTVDMANGPVQRTQPFPETIQLLEGLGAKNNHKCVSC